MSIPAAVGVEVGRAGVVAIGAAIAFGAGDDVVAIAVPAVEFVVAGGSGDLELHVAAAAVHGDELILLEQRAAVGRGDIGLAFAHGDQRIARGEHLDAIAAVAMRIDGHIRRIDFDAGLGAFQHGEEGQALRELHLDAILVERGDIGLGVLVQANHVGPVELNLGARPRAGENFVTGNQRRVQVHGGCIAGIAALHGDVAAYEADARNAGRLGVHLRVRCPSERQRRRS